jgi:hypothetical protein
MSMIDFIKKHLTNKTIVHLAMGAFAVTSTLNVAGFFAATHHHIILAASAGLALGAGLMAVSVYLSKQDMDHRLNFGMLLAAAVCMALLSGQIQAMGYRLHGLEPFTAYLLGYAPPFVVEILLALSVSLAERNERERVRRDSKGHIKDSVATAMTDAFRAVDTGRIQRHIDRQVDGVIRAFVDDALGEMMAELRGAGGSQPTDDRADSPQIADNSRPSIEEMNAERQRLIAERQHAIIDLIAAYGPMSTAEIVSRLSDDRDIMASERTVRGDCAALEKDGRLVKTGRKWDVAIAIALPTVATPKLNGVAHHDDL